MAGSAHTPGPWATHPNFPTWVVPADHVARPVGGAADDAEDLARYAQDICCLDLSSRHRHGDELRANARLIAAAPEMLKALKRLYEVSGKSRNVSEAREQAEAAIAKAEGK